MKQEDLPLVVTPHPRKRARTTDPETSHEAAESVTPMIRMSQLNILRAFRWYGRMTDYELIEAGYPATRLPHQSPSGLRTRRNELVKAGLLEDSGKREVLPSGRKAIVWQVVKR